MKQFQIPYTNDESLLGALAEIRQWCAANPAYTVLFRIYSASVDLPLIRHVCGVLDEQMPSARYFGCTTHSNLLNGALSREDIILTCTVFEYETTQAELLCLPFTQENAVETVTRLKEYCDANPWVSAVELHATMLGMSMRTFCGELSTLQSDIQIFGGGACNPNPNIMSAYVFTKETGFLEHGIVFLLLGGPDFHACSTFITGWKPLRRKFKVTKAQGEILHELDGEPAFNIYQRFLNIEKSDNLVSNTLEFPLFMDDNGVEIMRCPIMALDDDSLVMTSEVTPGADVRLAYGDPETILASVLHDGQAIADFQPDVIQTFSCGARLAFWGNERISDETLPFNGVAPTSGFYTGGEFLRIDGAVHALNVTLVFAAMREGAPKNDKIVDLCASGPSHGENDRIPLIFRFVSFIEASTAEFEKANLELAESNWKLAQSNQKLAVSSVTDGLTGLYNRAEIERRIRGTLNARAQEGAIGDLSVIMLDIDDFKKINDRYGHKEGDRVIIAMANILRKILADIDCVSLGRWGGEEFMALLPHSNMDDAAILAEKIRHEFASLSYETAGCQTVSIGVCQAKDGEDADDLYRRVDKALYTAKAHGKNRVVTPAQ